MQATTILLDWQDILRWDGYWIHYSMKDWYNGIQISDGSTDRTGRHGRDVTPTKAVLRSVTLAGYIDRVWNVNEFESVKWLEQLFALQSNPSILTPRMLTITDIYGRVLEMPVKIKEKLIIEEWNSEFVGSHWAWRCSLESIGDPTLIGQEEYTINTQEWTYGGWNIPVDGFTLDEGISFDDYLHLVQITPEGNISAYPIFTFTVTNPIDSPLVIRNITKGTTFQLDVWAVAGDIIVVDSNSKLCTKNGVNINALRIIGSIWPTIDGETSFLFEDIDSWQAFSDFDVSITYKNRLL